MKREVYDEIRKYPGQVDLTKSNHSVLVQELADYFIKNCTSEERLNIENEFLSRKLETQTFPLLALKMARSKILISSIRTPFYISVVFAVYKEQNRILSNEVHAHGEDFLRVKFSQLEWLFSDNPNGVWKVLVVDDGCPEGSGGIAENIIKENCFGDKAQVIFLEKAIQEGYGIAKGMTSTADSQKGGSIIYGMQYVVDTYGEDNHVVVYTDADLSTHLGQVGLLVYPIINEDKAVSIGSRRENDSVVVKAGVRNNRGKMFIYLWKKVIPLLDDIIDTQCGFKAFRADIVRNITNDAIEKKFAFDIELLVKAKMLKPDSVKKVSIAWIDSEEASTTTDIQPYLPMLKSVAAIYRSLLEDDVEATEYVDFIERLTDADFDKLLNNIPAGILTRKVEELGAFRGVTVSDLNKLVN